MALNTSATDPNTGESSKNTLGNRLDEASGRPSGFDYLRLILALSVLIVHSVYQTHSDKSLHHIVHETSYTKLLVIVILPMFFTLSGFLVAGSMYRCKTIFHFLGLRGFRIYPALFVEVLLTAFILGPFITSLSWNDYFLDPGFLRYLWNVTGDTTVYLPGSFSGNPRPGLANIQLWTVPYELWCYIMLALLVLLGGKWRRSILLVGTVFIAAAIFVRNGLLYDWKTLPDHSVVHGDMLVISFLSGVCLYAYRYSIPANGPWLLIAILATAILFSGPFETQYLGLLTVSYVTCALGVRNATRLTLLKHADLSYGIFLYHAIIQQTLIYTMPEGMRTWYWVLLTSLPVSIGFAYLSWHCIEKPVLSRKHVLVKLEDRYLSMRTRLLGG